MASAAFTFLSLLLFPPDRGLRPGLQTAGWGGLTAGLRDTSGPLMALALPLMGNRLVLNFLGSAEAIWIPNRLVRFGLTNSEAFSVYGVLTGMSLPFILFPSAITNSMAVLLLPTVAEAQSDGNEERISSVLSMSLRYKMCIRDSGQLHGLAVAHDTGYIFRAGTALALLEMCIRDRCRSRRAENGFPGSAPAPGPFPGASAP